MPEGLEFLKSWRFWAWLVGSTATITFGTAAVHLVSIVYLPARGGEADPIYRLAAAVVLVLVNGGLLWRVYGRHELERRVPREYAGRVISALAAVGFVVCFLEFHIAQWLLVGPVLPSHSVGGLYFLAAWGFAITIGRWIAAAEWAAMTGADDGDGRESV